VACPVVFFPRSNTFSQVVFVSSDDYLGDDVVVVDKCVVCHSIPYITVIVSEPAVNVVVLYPPEVVVDEVSPAPTVIV